MNPETPQNPREQLESRLTALLLGELNADEAAALRQIIACDAALAALHERLRQTIDLVRVAAYDPATETAEQPAPLKLSDSRRQKLLAEFKTVKPPQFAPPPRRRWYALHPLAAAAAVVAVAGLAALMAIPNLMNSATKSRAVAIASNLRQLDGAKQQWAQEMKVSADAVPTMKDLEPYLGRGHGGSLTPVAGETYKIGKMGESPSAEMDPKQAQKLFQSPAAADATVYGVGGQKVGDLVAEYHAPEPRQLGILLTPPVPKVELKLDGGAYAQAGGPPATAKTGEPVNVYSVNAVGYVDVSDAKKEGAKSLAATTPPPVASPVPPMRTEIVLPSTGESSVAQYRDGVADTDRSPAGRGYEIPVRTLNPVAAQGLVPLRDSEIGRSQEMAKLDTRATSVPQVSVSGGGFAAGGSGAVGGSGGGGRGVSNTVTFAIPEEFVVNGVKNSNYPLSGIYYGANQPQLPTGAGSTVILNFTNGSFSDSTVQQINQFYAGTTRDDVGGQRYLDGKYVNANPITMVPDDSGLRFKFMDQSNDPRAANGAPTETAGRTHVGGTFLTNVQYASQFGGVTNTGSMSVAMFGNAVVPQPGLTLNVTTTNRFVESSNGALSSTKGIDWSGTLQSQTVNFGNGLARADNTLVPPASASPSATDRLRGIRGSAGPANLAFTNGSVVYLGDAPNLAHRFAFAAADEPQPSQIVEQGQRLVGQNGLTQTGVTNNELTMETWSAYGGTLSANAVDSLGGATAVLQNQNVAQTQSGSATPGMTHRWSFNEPPETIPANANTAVVAGGAVTMVDGTTGLPLAKAAPPAQGSAAPQPTAGPEPKGFFPGSAQVQTFTGIQTDEQFRRAMSPKDKSTIVLPATEQPTVNIDDFEQGTATGKTSVAAANKVEPGPIVSPRVVERAVALSQTESEVLRKRLDTPALAEQAGAGRGSGGGAGGGGGAGAGGGFGGGFATTDGARDYPNSTVYGPVTVSIEPETGRVFLMADQKTPVSIDELINNLDRSGGNTGGLVQLNLMQLGTPTTIDGNAVPTTTPGSVLAKVVDLADAQRLRNLARRRGTNGNPGQVAVEEASKLGAGAGDSSGTAIGDGRMMFDETTKRSYIVTDKNVYEKLADVATFQNRGEAANTTASKSANTSVTNSGIHPVFQTTAGVTGAPGGNQVTWVDDSGKPVNPPANVQIQKAYNVPQSDRQLVPRPNIFNRTNYVRTGGAGTNGAGGANPSVPVPGSVTYAANTGTTNVAGFEVQRRVAGETSTNPVTSLRYFDRTRTNMVIADGAAGIDAKQRELDQLRQQRNKLATDFMQETVELRLPKEALVVPVDAALAQSEGKPTLTQRLGGLFTGDVTRTATVRLQREQSDGPAPRDSKTKAGAYDPFFVESEARVIKSEPVLDKVIAQLNLNSAWAEKKGADKPLTTEDTRQLLKKNLEVGPVANTGLLDIRVKSKDPQEAATIANAVAKAYSDYRNEEWQKRLETSVAAAQNELKAQDQQIARAEQELAQLQRAAKPAAQPTPASEDRSVPPTPAPPLVPQPEVLTRENAFSTFSLNVADVAFKLAAASLQKGLMPDPGTVRSEEFINAFDYRDSEPAPGAAVAFASEQAHYPFAHNRDLLRFSLKTAAAGRVPGRPLNLVLLLDKSGSMERADRVAIIREALRVLAGQLQPGDKISVITFARLAHLWADGVSGEQAAAALEAVSGLTPEGGTNLEEAMRLAYATALRHYLANGVNRVVLLTDGAANLGNVDPAALKVEVETHRKQGIALDCFGIGWEGYNDDLLEVLSRNGDGRYGFINSPEEAATGFAGQLAGALRVAASDVKVQVEFNPKRVTSYRQIGYAKHQLTKEQFRDNTVNAAQIGAAEAGNALYTVEVNPAGEGPLATVHVRYRDPGTQNYYEHEWAVPYTGLTVDLDRASPAMRLAGTASAFSEWLAASPYAGEVTTDHLLTCLSGVPEVFGADARPKQLEWMIRQAKSISGK